MSCFLCYLCERKQLCSSPPQHLPFSVPLSSGFACRLISVPHEREPVASASVRLTSVDVHPRHHQGRGLTLREDEVSASRVYAPSLALVHPRRPPCLRASPPLAEEARVMWTVVRQGPAQPESGDSSHHRRPCPCRALWWGHTGWMGWVGWTRLPAPAGGGCSFLCVHGATSLRLPGSPLQKDEPQHLPMGSNSQFVNIRPVKPHSHPGARGGLLLQAS